LKKLKFHLASFDMVVKERTTATAITEGTRGFEHTKACFRDDIIPFVKNLKELFTSFDQCLIDEVTKVQNIFKQMKQSVEQHCAEKTKFQTKMENVLQENDRLLTQALSVEIVNIVLHDNRDTLSSPESAPTFAELFEINALKAQIQEKDTVILKLKEKLNSFSGDVKERKVKREVEEIETQNLELDHKVDVALLVPNLRKNRTGHTDYIRHTQEEVATLREIVESERLLSPLNTSLAYACKYTRRIQELLMILQQTCPIITDLGTQLVAVTPKNKIKQIRSTAQITKSERTTVTTSPSANIDSNTPVLSSTGVTLQMELAVEQHCAEKNKFQTKMEKVLQENDRLLTQALNVEIVNIVVHDYVNVDCLNVDVCVPCVTTESELKPDFIKKECYETLLQQYHILETHCISLEVNNQLNTEIFQRDTVSSTESAPTFAELFEINDLKAQNLELDHKVTKLVAENEHLKQTYKQLFDSIKSLRVQTKEQCDDLINKVNLKSVEVFDLNASLQEKVLVITALKEQLSKLKDKAVLPKAVSLKPFDLALLQVYVAPLVPKLRKNRTAHIDYIRHTQEEAATFREIVESERLLSPLNTSLDCACKYTRRIQELLMILQQTCPSITDLRTNLVAVTPKNKTKQIRHTA
nr:hypothetical protein [Tanacetum cinerariifolium]